MARVRVLEKSVAERIAAGEVVERPASVVKELVENSLDAGASKITIELESGGIHRLRILDDGCGMSEEDARLALQRFATSKISRWEDLDELSSLGFRGEALPSIAAVSRLEILTCEPGAEAGTLLSVEGGEVVRCEPAAAPAGTRITVSDLYYNTPARRKFLRSPAAETSQVVELIGRMAMTRPEVQFRLLSNGKEMLMLPSGMSVRDRLASVLKISRDVLVEVAGMVEGVAVVGLVALPEENRGNRTGQTFTVNGRLVRDTTLSQALLEGFSPMLARGRFPVGMINLSLDPASVDVNVHPTKAEVRFANKRSPFRAVHRTVAAALEAARAETVQERHLEAALDTPPEAPAPPLAWSSPARDRFRRLPPACTPPPRPLAEMVLETYRPLTPSRPANGNGNGNGKSSPAPAPPTQAELGLAAPEEIRVLAQLYNSYIVATVNGELWVVDQHAAHERINYEKLSGLSPLHGGSQGLLVPEVLEFAPSVAVFLEGHLEDFASLGFEVEEFGPRAFAIRSVPAGIKPEHAGWVLKAVVDEAAEGGLGSRSETPQVLREKLRAMVACKSSIRARESLSHQEMEQLLRDLLVAERSPFCPHGRPTRVRLDTRALERLFHR